MEEFNITEKHAEMFVDKLYEILGRKNGVIITRTKGEKKEEKDKNKMG